MAVVTSRELRNHTAAVLRRVAHGTPVTVTVNGVPVADITPHRPVRPAALTLRELLGIVRDRPADAGLRSDLQDLTGDDTDSLGPLP